MGRLLEVEVFTTFLRRSILRARMEDSTGAPTVEVVEREVVEVTVEVSEIVEEEVEIVEVAEGGPEGREEERGWLVFRGEGGKVMEAKIMVGWWVEVVAGGVCFVFVVDGGCGGRVRRCVGLRPVTVDKMLDMRVSE